VTDTAVIYFSSVGKHVANTASYIAKQLGADLFDLKKQSNIKLDSYGKVIIGTGVHFGKPYSRVSSFVESNKEELSKRRTALFVCCMSASEQGEKQCQDIANEYGIADAAFFPDGSAKNGDGVSADADAFVGRMRL